MYEVFINYDDKEMGVVSVFPLGFILFFAGEPELVLIYTALTKKKALSTAITHALLLGYKKQIIYPQLLQTQ
tara:strand:- start:1614 stop:1829 length:216 start_codon:yes stop_codon:yes gene_type:complete